MEKKEKAEINSHSYGHLSFDKCVKTIHWSWRRKIVSSTNECWENQISIYRRVKLNLHYATEYIYNVYYRYSKFFKKIVYYKTWNAETFGRKSREITSIYVGFILISGEHNSGK